MLNCCINLHYQNSHKTVKVAKFLTNARYRPLSGDSPKPFIRFRVGWIAVWIVAVAMAGFGTGCATSRTSLSIGQTGSGEVYEASNDEIRSLIFTAMYREFPGSVKELPSSSIIGYEAETRFMLDSHTISAFAAPVRGFDFNQEPMDGFVFEVNDSGTMPLSQKPRASRVFQNVLRAANDSFPSHTLTGIQPRPLVDRPTSLDGPPEKEPKTRTGSGFVSSAGFVLTCAHVIDGADSILVTAHDGSEHKATVHLLDRENDWTLLAVPTLDRPALELAPRKSVRLGDRAYVISYPLHGILSSAGPVAGSGEVAALQGLGGDIRHFQVTIPANPGSSGAPVLDSHGRWIGILSHGLADAYALAVTGTIPQGINFAIRGQLVASLAGEKVAAANDQEPELPKRTLADLVAGFNASIVRVRAN